MTPATLTPAARNDLREAVIWIAKDSPLAAQALRDSVARAGALLAEHPLAGSLRPEFIRSPYRCYVLRGFPYILIYNPEHRPARIVRILHAARDLPAILWDQ